MVLGDYDVDRLAVVAAPVSLSTAVEAAAGGFDCQVSAVCLMQAALIVLTLVGLLTWQVAAVGLVGAVGFAFGLPVLL